MLDKGTAYKCLKSEWAEVSGRRVDHGGLGEPTWRLWEGAWWPRNRGRESGVGGGLGGERMRGAPVSSCFQFSPDEEASSQGGCWVGGVEGLKTGGGEVSSIGGNEGNSLGASGRIVVCPLENSGRVCFRAAGGVGEAGT